MDDAVVLNERPVAQEIYLVAGWRQWADAGSISSELPLYLVEQMSATKIGEIRADGFYLFQIPGTHDLLRPEIKLSDGHADWVETRKNEFYYAGNEEKGLVIFCGDEPHRNVVRYADAFLDVVEALGIKRSAVVAGVYGAMPYDRDRQISCVYSLPAMRQDLSRFAVQFSNYEGGASIGTCLAHQAELRSLELLAFYGMVPYYDFSQVSAEFTGIQIERDLKAWYDIMARLKHMFGLDFDLSDLEAQSETLLRWMEDQVDDLDQKSPHLNVREHIRELSDGFQEMSFAPLSEVWERELRDLFEDDR